MTPTMRVRAVIEVLGTPKEHVERTMGAVVEKLRERKDFTMEAHHYAEVPAGVAQLIIEGKK